jgi:aspartyl-tRNA synthetase
MQYTDFLERTHTCGQLRAENAGSQVILNGWVQRRRDLGGLIFIDLRDRWGITQVVFNPQENPDLFKTAEKLRNEYVISVKGSVRRRPDGAENRNIPTGQIEVTADVLQILNSAKNPPFEIKDDLTIDESLRLRYRYLDLRRPTVFKNFQVRHKFTKAIRDYLDGKDFLEVETPTFIRSTPEGARDYLVPSRIHPGEFYALPQSPQLLKQILMVSGCERYFQLARCYRDEDLRADRQLEFTQVDMEMSFVKQDDILKLVEDMLAHSFKEVLGKDLPVPFPRISWQEAQERYGCDKPDIRFGMEIVDITSIVRDSGFAVFSGAISSGGRIKGIKLPGCAGYSRKQIDEFTEYAKKLGASGVLTVALKPGDFKSPASKHLTDTQKEEIKKAFDAKDGDFLAILAGDSKFIGTLLGRIRLKMGRDLNLIDTSKDGFLWVTEFPMFAYDEEEGHLVAEHHPFTSPKLEDLKYMESDPLKVRAQAYDLVYNGNEVASGSIRIFDQKLQEEVFKVIGISKEEAYSRFSFLLNAFEYGVPPHGGIALGYDRLIAIICNEDSIREVIAFPKNTAGICLLTGAPVCVDQEQLDILSIEIKRLDKKCSKPQVVEVL